ncbi:MAG: hypothetical protein QOH13_687, partial [Thermoleophilaceae bacterium]|nr:hypothetical protein [Thermoleophilaceae bacterium]
MLPLTRTPLYLALALAAAIPAALAGPAHSDDPPVPQEVLPDLRQLLPANVKVGSIGGQWRLGFDSEVVNDGPGYLKIRGTGPGGGPMTADQVIQMDDGSSTTVPGIGEMHYVMANHNHWHLLDFERYELRNGDSDQTLVTDQKTGFCLADSFTTTFCGQNQPGLTSVEEGISSHGSDRYLGYLEGQYIVVSQATVPDGSYVLVHRVNPAGALHVANPANDAASVRITMAWTNGTPNMAVVNQCPGTTICPAPPDPPPTDPKPDPQPEPAPATTTPAADPVTTAPGPELPAPEPQPVPIVNPVPQIAGARAAMSRGMAVR